MEIPQVPDYRNISKLSPAEIKNPLLVVARFFDDDNLEGHLERLKEWRRCVLEEVFFTGDKNSPSELLYFYQMNISLIEGIYLLQGFKEAAFHDKQDEHAGDLSKKEKQAPFAVIKNFFHTYSLSQYKEFLYEWLEHGLSSSAAREFIETADLIAVYENLQSLYGAVLLLHQMPEKAFPVVPLRPMAEFYELDPVISNEMQPVLMNIVSITIEKIPSVQAIIYLGKPSGDLVNLYLLVLTENNEPKLASVISNTIEECCKTEAGVIALVHHASKMIDALADLDFFFCIANNCPFLYLSGGLFLPANGKRSPIPTIKQAVVWTRWQQQGKDFYSGADYYLRNGAYSAALFSLHQCAECCLIALIRGVFGYRVNAHNLSRLLYITQMFTGDLHRILKSDDEKSKLFRILQDAYIKVRYKDGYQAPAEHVWDLFVMTGELLNATESVYKRFTQLKQL